MYVANEMTSNEVTYVLWTNTRVLVDRRRRRRDALSVCRTRFRGFPRLISRTRASVRKFPPQRSHWLADLFVWWPAIITYERVRYRHCRVCVVGLFHRFSIRSEPIVVVLFASVRLAIRTRIIFLTLRLHYVSLIVSCRSIVTPRDTIRSSQLPDPVRNPFYKQIQTIRMYNRVCVCVCIRHLK